MLALALIALCSFAVCNLTSLAFTLGSAPAVLDRPPLLPLGRAEVEDAGTSGRRSGAGAGAGRRARNATSSGPALKLGDEFPPAVGSEVAHGPRWATCFVEARLLGRISFDGVTSSRSVLEEWVVRGERERVSEFRAWRSRQANEGDSANIRCVPTSAKSAEDSFCLECISHSGYGAFPFTPQGTVTIHESGAIMTFSGLHECLASTAGAGYCKTGTVAVAA